MANMLNDHFKNLVNANQKLLDELMNDPIIKTTEKISNLHTLIENAQVLDMLDR